MKNKKAKKLQRVSYITLIAVYFLILVGGIVRSTGSGMGCPDWPKCFGRYIPPTSVDQLPADYKEQYSNQRHQKNIRFAKMVERLGYTELADKLRNDESIKEEADFNATKTWIEYINRLIGVIIGFLILLTFWHSLKLWKSDRKLVLWSFFLVVLVLFQGWIGSIVVSSNLLPGMITFHMLLAMLIVLVLIYINSRSASESQTKLLISKLEKRSLIVLLILMAVQVLLGTKVREGIDLAAALLGEDQRYMWVGNLGSDFYIHRSFSLLILGLEIFVLYKIIQNNGVKALNPQVKWIVALTAIEIVGGAAMAYFGVPPFIQPVHLLIGTLLVGLLYHVLISTKTEHASITG